MRVENLIAKRKESIQLLDELLKSTFLEMFGDPVRNEKGWKVINFETIISDLRNGLSPAKAGTEKGLVYSLSAITGNCFQEIYKEDTFTKIFDKYFPQKTDFLICRGNGNMNLVGKGYFFPGSIKEVMFPDTIIAVTVQSKSINKHFFEVLWNTKFIRQQIEKNARTTNGTYKINQGVIKNINLICPPTDQQNRFALIVKKVETLKIHCKKSLVELENLYASISQRAFNGELDLSRISTVKS